MYRAQVKLPGKSPRIREAEIDGAAIGALGGFCWSVPKVMKDRPLLKEKMAAFNYLVQGRNCTVTINRVRDVVPFHIHKFNDETIYFLEGRGEFTVGDKRYPVKSGTLLYVPMSTVHGGPIYEPITILAIYSPNFDIRKPDRVFVDEEGNEVS